MISNLIKLCQWFPTCHLLILALQSHIQMCHMVVVHLRLPGSLWPNRQGRLRETNRAVLILLIVRNVLIETRKRLFHMISNQSHAPHLISEDTCWTAALSSFKQLQRLRVPLIPAEAPQDNVSSQPGPCHHLCNDTSDHCHLKQRLSFVRCAGLIICSWFEGLWKKTKWS